jgi:hypothetical protein
VEILKIWSDQIPGAVANFLPGGSGASNYDYILMGSTNRGVWWLRMLVKAEVKITPNTPENRSKVVGNLYADGGAVPVGASTWEYDQTNKTVIVSIALDQFNISDVIDYSALVWLDVENTGVFNKDLDPYTTKGKFKFITSDVYNNGVTSLRNVVWYSWYPYAAFNLDAFLNDTAVFGATAEWTTIHYNAAGLTHNVGAIWDSAGNASVRLNTFQGGGLAGLAKGSYEFREQVIAPSLSELKPIIQSYKANIWPPNEPEHRFGPWRMPLGMNFGDTSNPASADLHYALGHVNVNGSVYVTVRRTDLELIKLELVGSIDDLYDFDWSSGGLARTAASVQAGYNTLGVSGHIYYVKIILDDPNYPYQYNFG